MREITQAIQQFQQAQKLSQKGLSELTGVNASQMSRILGEEISVSPENLSRLYYSLCEKFPDTAESILRAYIRDQLDAAGVRVPVTVGTSASSTKLQDLIAYITNEETLAALAEILSEILDGNTDIATDIHRLGERIRELRTLREALIAAEDPAKYPAQAEPVPEQPAGKAQEQARKSRKNHLTRTAGRNRSLREA